MHFEQFRVNELLHTSTSHHLPPDATIRTVTSVFVEVGHDFRTEQ